MVFHGFISPPRYHKSVDRIKRENAVARLKGMAVFLVFMYDAHVKSVFASEI